MKHCFRPQAVKETTIKGSGKSVLYLSPAEEWCRRAEPATAPR